MGFGLSKSARSQDTATLRRNVEHYKAIATFRPGSNDDLAFRVGDILEILVPKPNGNWWVARHPATRKQGFIPKNFVAKCDSIESEPWYFGFISRAACERNLKQRSNRSGTFLVRDSETYRGNYVLSVIHRGVINHYRIRCTDSGQFFIGNTQAFKSVQGLIRFHSQSNCGIPERLLQPCVRIGAPVLSDLSHHDEWEIKRSSIVLKKKLGAGQFGDVYQAVWNKKKSVAVKTLRSGTQTDRAEFLEEAKIMKQLQHPKLVQLLAVVTAGDPIYIVTELMGKGSLLAFLRSQYRKIQFNDVVDISEQIAEGMKFLESKNYIHRDLAARNVLVDEERMVKIADFGLARLSADEEYTAAAGSKFPIKWTAPEAACYNKFSTKSDVWSFGILLFEIVTRGRIPYADKTNKEVLESIVKGYRMPCPRGCPEKYYEIMFECWHANPLQRPTFETLQWKLEQYFERNNEHSYN